MRIILISAASLAGFFGLGHLARLLVGGFSLPALGFTVLGFGICVACFKKAMKK